MRHALCYRLKQIDAAHLVTKGVSTDDDRLSPPWYGFRNPLENDGFSEDGAAEDVTDLSVRGFVIGSTDKLCE